MSPFENLSFTDHHEDESTGKKDTSTSVLGTLKNLSFDGQLTDESKSLEGERKKDNSAIVQERSNDKEIINYERMSGIERNREKNLSVASNNKREQAQRTIETSRLLNTKDLPPLTDEQAKLIIQVLEENPEIETENGVTHEVATTLSFKTIDTKELSEIAVKMRHHSASTEIFDLQKSTNPKEKYFFASLASLVEAYNGSDQSLPVRGFKNLSGDEMTALHDSFLLLITEKYPHLNLDTNYKITELKSVAGHFLGAMNFIREKEETDMFSKVSLVSDSPDKNANETKDDLLILYDDFREGKIE